MPDGAITEGKVWGSLTKMDAPKAVGPDGVHPGIVGPLSEVLVKTFTQLLNALLDGGRLSRVAYIKSYNAA